MIFDAFRVTPETAEHPRSTEAGRRHDALRTTRDTDGFAPTGSPQRRNGLHLPARAGERNHDRDPTNGSRATHNCHAGRAGPPRPQQGSVQRSHSPPTAQARALPSRIPHNRPDNRVDIAGPSVHNRELIQSGRLPSKGNEQPPSGTTRHPTGLPAAVSACATDALDSAPSGRISSQSPRRAFRATETIVAGVKTPVRPRKQGSVWPESGATARCVLEIFLGWAGSGFDGLTLRHSRQAQCALPRPAGERSHPPVAGVVAGTCDGRPRSESVRRSPPRGG